MGAPPLTTQASVNIAAGLRLGWAWRHRGSDTRVTERGALNMVRLLDEAAEILDRSEPLDSVGRALRIRIEMGFHGSPGVLQRQLNAAAVLPESNIYVPINHLMFVAPKWWGSVDEILNVAREYAAGSKRPAWKALPAMAHAEVWLYKSAMSESAQDGADARTFYSGDVFADELLSIDDAFWRALAIAEEPMTHAEQVFAHNSLAHLAYIAGLSERVARHIERIGDDFSAIPWAYSGLRVEHRGGMRFVRAMAGLSD